MKKKPNKGIFFTTPNGTKVIQGPYGLLDETGYNFYLGTEQGADGAFYEVWKRNKRLNGELREIVKRIKIKNKKKEEML